ncbi:hypothetical protein HOLleu_37334 [Holothuria leucospilota]|uniref:Uncharacterized protein n=1 Tax=Holothuria leucospilota TaxID=206669 RepID=A0A9Q0YLQ2_HOLLE|nr:hypothetical protein HOLleu_37334 [Holothuria leucospilota]
MTAQELTRDSTWINGPQFLWERDLPLSHEEPDLTIDQHDPELKGVQAFSALTQNNSSGFELDRFDAFSNWLRLKRAVALCLRFKSILRVRRARDQTSYKSIKIEELEKAEGAILKVVQGDAFGNEIRILMSLESPIDRKGIKKRNDALKQTNALFRLDPYIDENGILRVGGRLRQSNFPDCVKHPVILPRNSHISKLIIVHFHDKVANIKGRSYTIGVQFSLITVFG